MALRPKCGEGARLGSSIPTPVLPRWGRGGSGPPGAPRSASLHPPHCSRPGGREEEQGQGPACGRRPVLQGRQEGSAGSVPPEPLACWSCCSSGLPVCPCSSRAGRAGCTPGGRSRPALPWRGSLPPFSLSLPQLHLAMAACSALPTCAPSTTADGNPRGLPLPTSPSCPEMPLHHPSVPPHPSVIPLYPETLFSDPCCCIVGTPAPSRPHPRSPIASSRPWGSAKGDLLLRRPLPGATWGPTSASRLSAADVAPAGCWLRAAGSASCVSTGAGDGTGWESPRPHVPAPRSALLLWLRQRLLHCTQPLLVPRWRAGRHLPR